MNGVEHPLTELRVRQIEWDEFERIVEVEDFRNLDLSLSDVPKGIVTFEKFVNQPEFHHHILDQHSLGQAGGLAYFSIRRLADARR